MMFKLHVLLGVLVVTTTAVALLPRHVRKTLPADISSEKNEYDITDSKKDQNYNVVTAAAPTVSTYSMYDHRHYMNSEFLAKESDNLKAVEAFTVDFDAELTTPQSHVFDHRHANFMDNINHDFEDRGRDDAVYDASSNDDKKVISDLPRDNITGDVSFDYSEKFSVVYNKSKTPNSARGDLFIENGTHVDFESIYVQTKVDPEINATTKYLMNESTTAIPPSQKHDNAHTVTNPNVKNNEINIEDTTIIIKPVNLIREGNGANDSDSKSSNIAESKQKNESFTVPPDDKSTTPKSSPTSKVENSILNVTTTTGKPEKPYNRTEVESSTESSVVTTVKDTRGRATKLVAKTTTLRGRSFRQQDANKISQEADTTQEPTTEIPEYNTVYPLKPFRTTSRPVSVTKPQNITASRRTFVIRRPATTAAASLPSDKSTTVSLPDSLTTNKTVNPSGRDNSIDKESSEVSDDISTVKPNTEEQNEMSHAYSPIDRTNRGSVKFGGFNVTEQNNTIDNLPIPYSASAWALTTLKQPSTSRKRTQSTKGNETSPTTEQQAEPTFIRLATLEQPGRGKTTESINNKTTSRTKFTSLSPTRVQSTNNTEPDSAVGDTSLNRIFAFPTTTFTPLPKAGENLTYVEMTTTDSPVTTTTEQELFTTISSNTKSSVSTDNLSSVVTTSSESVVENNYTTVPASSDTLATSAASTDSEEELTTTMLPFMYSELNNNTAADVNLTVISIPTTGVLFSTVTQAPNINDTSSSENTSESTETEHLQNLSSSVSFSSTDTTTEDSTNISYFYTTELSSTSEEISRIFPTMTSASASTVSEAAVNATESGVNITTDDVEVSEESTESDVIYPVQAPAYLRLVVQASFYNICQSANAFKESVASSLASVSKENVMINQVILLNIGRNQCLDAISMMNETSNLDFNPVQLYIIDSHGNFSTKLCDLYYKMWEQFAAESPLKIQKVEFIHLDLIDPPDNMSIGDEDDENVKVGIIAGIVISCIGGICLLLLAVLLVVMRKRQKKFNYGQRCTPVSLDAYSLDSVSVGNSVRRKAVVRGSKRSYGNAAFDDPGAPSHSINFAGLANFCSDHDGLEEEFNMIPQVTPKADELPEGSEAKNRYSNVIPLPETRVQLTASEGEALSDYINANYVRGPKGAQKFYIACQAPLQSTIMDFWRMVWEHQSKVILMLTDLVENDKEKCADYLPPSEVTDCHRLFGDYQVTLKKREVKEKYVISTLQLKNLETNSWREVVHLWYIGWPAKGVPEEANSIIAFLIEARAYTKGSKGPTIVHCSPGTGRTGTVLACDLCIREFEQTRMVDIPRCVYRLRRDRAGSVQTKEQYVFIYQVLNLYATKLTGGALDSI